MKEVYRKVVSVSVNIIRVMKLAYEIDKILVIKYYGSAAIGAILPIVLAFIIKVLFDYLISVGSLPRSSSAVYILFLLFVGYYGVQTLEVIIYWGLNQGYYDYLLRNKLQNGLMIRFLKKLGGLDLGHLENSSTQTLITKVRDSYQWKIPDFVRTWNYVFRNIVGLVIAGIALSPFGIWIPLVIVGSVIPRLIVKLKSGLFVWSMYGAGAPQAKKLWYLSWLFHDPKSITETRIFRSQDNLFNKIIQTQDHLYELNKKPLDSYRWVLIFAPIGETIIVINIISSFIPSMLSGVISIGTLSFILNSIGALLNSLRWGAYYIGELYESNLFIKPFFDMQSLPPLIHQKKDSHTFGLIESPRIEFKNVSFSYPKSGAVIKNISFVIEPKEHVAFVGRNGAGKSTIIKLLCRLYDVSSGEIFINNVDIRDLDINHWHKHLGTLFQDFMKYEFTIRENIMLGNPDIVDEDRMKQAAQDAGADTFINNFVKGYDQPLGKRFEDGEELSGGQWQKLAIARAFYQQAPVLILDEPTSAIDVETEYKIFTNLEKRYRDKTLILVSHRFSTVRNADKIIVVDNGKIIESGSHNELLKNKALYWRMFHLQAKGYQ